MQAQGLSSSNGPLDRYDRHSRPLTRRPPPNQVVQITRILPATSKEISQQSQKSTDIPLFPHIYSSHTHPSHHHHHHHHDGHSRDDDGYCQSRTDCKTRTSFP